ITTPCARLQQAVLNVAAGGEVGVLSPGDYGTATIDKSVRIINDGTGEANISAAPGLAALSISAGAGDIVTLRGLVIDGKEIGGAGIAIVIVSAVHIQNCTIGNFESPSLGIGLSFSALGNSQLFVSDTIIFNNGGRAASGGVVIQAGGTGSANVVL